MEKSPEAFRTISEVSDLLETPAHVLRFWESRFPQIRPVKRAGGRRYYRPSDVALLGGIKRLLHEDGLTIRGVQKILREQGIRHVSGLGGNPVEAAITLDAEPETAEVLPFAARLADAPEAETAAPEDADEDSAAALADAPAEDEAHPDDAADAAQVDADATIRLILQDALTDATTDAPRDNAADLGDAPEPAAASPAAPSEEPDLFQAAPPTAPQPSFTGTDAYRQWRAEREGRIESPVPDAPPHEDEATITGPTLPALLRGLSAPLPDAVADRLPALHDRLAALLDRMAEAARPGRR